MRELRERAGPVLKIVCLILAVVVVCQLAGIFIRWNPFRGVTVPALPSLTDSTNSPTGGKPGANPAASSARGTNSTPRPPGTNTATLAAGANTNSTLQKMPAGPGTNMPPQTVLIKTNASPETNGVAHLEIKMTGTNLATATNPVEKGTNVLTVTKAATMATATATNVAASPETNGVAHLEIKLTGTNSAMATNLVEKGTNALIATTATATVTVTATNAVTGPKSEMKIARAAPGPEVVGMVAGMNFNPFAPPGKRVADLPPAVQARISRITDSEILGPVIHPLPMGLLGIAGEYAFLRSASGQTGLVKEGDSLDDLKLLRIGINRVLIEQDGQKKELMIFSGYGGDSLLPTNTPDENNQP
jgi:hypothetical protein